MEANTGTLAIEVVVNGILDDAADIGVSAVIVPEEATILRAYFKACGSAVDISPMGKQLDRTALYAVGARPCTRCGGDIAKLIGGCGWMPSKKEKREATPEELALLKFEGKLKSHRVMLPPRADVPCESCNGRGWVTGKKGKSWHTKKMFWVSKRYVNGTRGPLQWCGPYTHAEAEEQFEELSCVYDDVSMAKARTVPDEVTARPTGSSVPLGSNPDNDSLIHRFAIVSRRLAEMDHRWALSVDVLDTFFGHEGGSLQTLWPLTNAGKTLLRRNRLKVPPLQFFENERRDQVEKKDPNRRKLFGSADSQSRLLLTGAGALWNMVADEDLSSLIEGEDQSIYESSVWS